MRTTIWINGVSHDAVTGQPINGFSPVTVFHRGLPISEHLLPQSWLKHPRPAPIRTGGNVYSRTRPDP